MAKEMTAEEMISRAIIELQKPQPFFAHLLMRLNIKPLPKDAKVMCRTMAVDGKGNMYYEADWVKKLDQDQVIGTICHEVLHVAFLHPNRVGSRHRELSNIAQDMVVNMMVTKTGFALPKEGIPYHNGNDVSSINMNGKNVVIEKVSQKAWEEIYAELLDHLNHDQSKAPSGRQGWDDHLEGDCGEEMTEKEQQEAQEKWQSAVAEAAQYAKQQGKLPGGMDRYIDSLLKPKVAWKQHLLKAVRPYVSPVEFSYHKPHKKSQQLGVFLPSTIKEKCEVEIIVDTSGSIGGKELDEFMTEVVAISRSHPYVAMAVSFVDTKIQGRTKINGATVKDILALKPRGGGGTRMEGGLDELKKSNDVSAPVVVVLTDGEDSGFTRKRHDYPFDVIWVISRNGISIEAAKRNIPYGSKIKME